MRAGGAAPDERPEPGPRPESDNWCVVVAAAVCTAMGSFDLFGVNVALPGLARQFGIDPALSQWIVTAYILPIAALALPMGRWMDRAGRRSSILFLVTGFCVASLLVALSPSAGALIAARVLQGMFGAGVFSGAVALTFVAVRPERRTRAVAVSSAVAPIGALAGPSLGALLTQSFGWRSIFLANVAVGALALLVFATRMRRDAPLRPPSWAVLREVLLLGTATASVLLALTVAPARGAAWYLLALLAGPLTVVWWATNRDAPLAHLLRVRGQPPALIAVALTAAAGIAVQYLLSFFAQRDLGLSVVDTGVALLALSAVSALAGPVGGLLAERFSPGGVAAAGLMLSAAATAAITPLDADWGIGGIAWRAGLLGLGQGLFAGPSITIAMGFGSADTVGSSSAVLQFVRNLGFVAGPVAATAVWSASGYRTGAIAADMWAAVTLTLLSAVLIAAAARRQAEASRGEALTAPARRPPGGRGPQRQSRRWRPAAQSRGRPG